MATAAAGRVGPYPDLLNGAWINTVHGITQRRGQHHFSLLHTRVLLSFPQTLGPAAASEVPAPRDNLPAPSTLLGEEMEQRPYQDVPCQGWEPSLASCQPNPLLIPLLALCY